MLKYSQNPGAAAKALRDAELKNKDEEKDEKEKDEE